MFQIYKKLKTTEPENPDPELENQDEPLTPTPGKEDKPAKPENLLAPSARSISALYEHAGKVSSFFSDLIGFEVLLSLHRDAKILLFCKTCRMFAFGFLSVMVRLSFTLPLPSCSSISAISCLLSYVSNRIYFLFILSAGGLSR